MQTTEEVLYEVAISLSREKAKITEIRKSIERCEALPSVITAKLLNLPTKVGKVIH